MAAPRRIGPAEILDEGVFLRAFGLEAAVADARQARYPASYGHLITRMVFESHGDDECGSRHRARSKGLAALYAEDAEPFGRPIKYFDMSVLQAAFPLRGRPGPHPGGTVAEVLAREDLQEDVADADEGAQAHSRAAHGAGSGSGSGADHGGGYGRGGRYAGGRAQHARQPRELSAEDYQAIAEEVLVPELLPLIADCPEGLKWWGQHPFAVTLTRSNCAKLGVPNYFTRIDEAMDFTTMMNNCKSGRYRSAVEFVMHLKLIAANATTFNVPGNPFHAMGSKLDKHAQQLQTRLLPRWDAAVAARQAML